MQILNTYFDGAGIDRAAQQFEAQGLHPAKLAVAALVMDREGRIMVCVHDQRPGESEEGALGSLTETLRYVPSRGDRVTETPLEAIARCLVEEHGEVGKAAMQDDVLHIDREEPAFYGEWRVGLIEGRYSTYPTVNVLLRTDVPGTLATGMGRRSEEILDVYFEAPDKVFDQNRPKRPGYEGWLKTMLGFVGENSLGEYDARPIEWPQIAVTDRNVRWPFKK